MSQSTHRPNHRCECGSVNYLKEWNYLPGDDNYDTEKFWECTNCCKRTPRVAFTPRTSGDYTPSQKAALARLNQEFEVETVERHEGAAFISVMFNNKEEHAMLRNTYWANITPMGWTQIKMVSSLLSDKSHDKVLASLATHQLFKSTVRLYK